VITGDQLLAHLIGDYVLQSDWMASNKRTDNGAALAHAIGYSLPFLLKDTPELREELGLAEPS
jgi:hypothetical protein